ncbi:MAG: RNA polymerase sigma factor [Pseudomonadota bacterium]
MVTDDNALAAEARDGDRAAFASLLARHYDHVYRLALRFTGHREDAEDLAQDVVVSLPAKLRQFDGAARFRTWLYRVVFNAAVDRRRSSMAREQRERDYVDVAALVAADDADRATRAEWLNSALQAMKPELRDTAVLVLSEDLTHAEAAEILGVKESTVSWRMHELKKALTRFAEQEIRVAEQEE